MKKPFYKKWWFWVIIVLVVGFIFSDSGEKDDADQNNEPKTEQATEKKENQTIKKAGTNKKEVAVGEVGKYKKATLKVDDVKWLEPDEFSDVQGDEQILAVKITMGNEGSERLDYNPFDFKVNCDGKSKDEDWIVPEQYAEIENEKFDNGELEQGAQTTGWICFPANQNASSIKLEWFENSVWDSKPSITVNLK